MFLTKLAQFHITNLSINYNPTLLYPNRRWMGAWVGVLEWC